MTTITRDDVRAAISAGTLSEAQAASLIVLAEERAGVRAHLKGLDEPFELFKGFNEVFIVVGLAILAFGYAGITGMTLLGTSSGYILGMIYAAVGMAAVLVLAHYFTRTRRMVGPSNALAIMFGLLSGQFGLSFSAMLDLTTPQTLTASAAIAAVLLSAYYMLFRVPFTVALVALSVFAAAFGVATLGGSFPETPRDMFLLSAEGPFAVLTMTLGLVGLVIAMIFDMSDPHRVTRRSASGFWLHVLAAPAIVNTVALTLFDAGTIPAQLLLAAFIALDRPDPPRNRLRTRPLHHRPEGRQARRRRGAAQPLAAQAAARRSARRGLSQEHPDDRPHRRRQDRDQPPPGRLAARPSSRSRPPSSPRSAMSAATSSRSSAIWWTPPSSWTREHRCART
jgi:hypothetical protein